MLEVLRTIVAWSEYIVVYFNDLAWMCTTVQ